jgi:hypothetical protein
MEYFEINKIHLNIKDPSYEDLGLVLGWDGLLHLPDLDWDILLKKIGGKKIKGAVIFNFHSVRYIFSSKPFLTPNRLLIIEREAFWAPHHDIDLLFSHKIEHRDWTKINYKLWCLIHHYHYHPEYYDEEKLLELLKD